MEKGATVNLGADGEVNKGYVTTSNNELPPQYNEINQPQHHQLPQQLPQQQQPQQFPQQQQLQQLPQQLPQQQPQQFPQQQPQQFPQQIPQQQYPQPQQQQLQQYAPQQQYQPQIIPQPIQLVAYQPPPVAPAVQQSSNVTVIMQGQEKTAQNIIITTSPSNHMFFSWFVCLFCFFPFGIAAIWASFKVEEKFDNDNYAAARSYSRLARGLAWAGFICGPLLFASIGVLNR